MRLMLHKCSRFISGQSVASRGRGRPARRKPPGRRLQIERLEDRLALTALTVTSGADSGPGSLRAEIAAANSGDTIVFAHNVHTVTLTSGELLISKNLDIEGPGADKLTINGNDASFSTASRVFDVRGPVIVTIAGVTVANGEAVVTEYLGMNGGGGILNQAGATLFLNNCVLTGNEAVLSPSTPSPTSNSAPNAMFGDVCGGGLLNEGTAYLNGTTVTRNEALGGGSYSYPLGGSTGGGIDNWDGATLFVTNCTIIHNEAISAADPVGATYPYFALGGGIANHAGAVTDANGNTVGNNNPSTVTITNSTVADNEATGGTGVYTQGGGILNTNGTFSLPYTLAVTTISNCTISGNLAVAGDNGIGLSASTGVNFGVGSEFSAANGGGVYNAVGMLTVDNSTLSGNEAVGGSDSAPATGGVASPATGSGQGGGMVNLAGMATVSNCTLIDNKAIGGNTTTGPGAITDGGGISNWGTALNEFGMPGLPGILTLTNSALIGNQAIAGRGANDPSGYSGAVWGFAAGGGLDVAFSGNATVTNCTLIGNQAIGSNAVNGGTGFGGGISLGFSYFFNTAAFPVVDLSTLSLSDSRILGNIAQGGSGAATGTGGNGLGGGLAMNPGSSATIATSAIDFNLALGAFGGTVGEGIGGGVYNDSGTFNKDLLTLLAYNFASTSNDNIFP